MGLEGDRVRGDARRGGHLHHRLQHGEPRPDGGAHRRLDRGRAGADAVRPRPPDAAVLGDPDHPRAGHRGRLQRPVRAGPEELGLLRDRGQSPRQPLVRARLQGDGLPDRSRGGQGRGRPPARRDPQRGHRPHVRRLRARARLLRGQDPALALRQVSRRRPAAGHADGVHRRGHGDRAHLRGRAGQGDALARAEAARHVRSLGPETIDQPNDRRLFALLNALRNGAEPAAARRSAAASTAGSSTAWRPSPASRWRATCASCAERAFPTR